MIAFKNEQYLPCSVPKIVYTHERREILDRKVLLYLTHDLFVYPMNAGFLLENNYGDYLVDSIDLLQSVNGKCVNEICHSDKDSEEIEQYFHYGLVGFKKGPDRKLVFPEIDPKYLQLNEDTNTTWFCQLPLKIELDVTKRCNLKCKHCSREASSRSTDGKMSLQDYVDVIRQAGRIGIPELSFMGGEPTCNPAFIELATLAKMSGIRTLFTSTNGWLVDEDLARKMAVLFDSIQVSIHGADSRTHDTIVGRGGAFERACKAVRLFVKKEVPSLNISCTLMNENANQMDAMVQLARDLKAPSIRFLMLFAKGRGSRLDQWENKDKIGVSDKIRMFREEEAGGIRIEGGGLPAYSSIRKDATIYGCPAGRSLMYIDADGDVTACGNLSHVIGNIRNKEILDLWHSPAMKALRKKPSCDCSYTGICAGGCLGNEHWGKMFNVDTPPIM